MITKQKHQNFMSFLKNLLKSSNVEIAFLTRK